MILLNGNRVEFETFPNNETKLKEETISDNLSKDKNTIYFQYLTDLDLIKLMFVKKYLEQLSVEANLIIAYMPYSRMDRSENNSGFTLKYVASFINDLNFATVKIVEPHSDITPALINKCVPVMINYDLLPLVINDSNFDKENDYIMFPDGGASKRYKLDGYKQLIGHKERDFKTGQIKRLDILGEIPDYPFKVIIVDDLSSYGGTFLLSAEKLKEIGASEVYLLVAHAENSILKGKIFKTDLIDKVYTTNSIIHESEANKKLKIYDLKEFILND